MAVSNSSESVGLTAVKIVDGKSFTATTNQYYDPSVFAKYVYLQDGDFDGDTTTYVGGDSVTASNGIKLSKTNTTVFQLHSGDDLYAISDGAGGSVRVIEVG